MEWIAKHRLCFSRKDAEVGKAANVFLAAICSVFILCCLLNRPVFTLEVNTMYLADDMYKKRLPEGSLLGLKVRCLLR
jgi:hypothetical protein